MSEFDQERDQEREEALDMLARAIDGKSPEHLQERYMVATGFGKLSPELEQRYRARMAQLQRVGKRRRILAGLGVVICIAIAVAVIVFFNTKKNYDLAVKLACDELVKFTTSNQPEKGPPFIETLPPRVQRDPKIQELLAGMQKDIEHEKQRQVDFAKIMEGLRPLVDEATKSLEKLEREPDQVALDRMFADLTRLQTELGRAKKLAKMNADRADVGKSEEAIENARKKWQGLLDDAFLAQYKQFDERLTQLERDKVASSADRRHVLDDVSEARRKWEEASIHVTAEYRPKTKTIQDYIRNLEDKADLQAKEENYEKQITGNVGDIQLYRGALLNFADHNPDSESTPGLKRAARESPCWQAVADWNKVAERLRPDGIAGMAPDRAAELLTLIASVSDNFGDTAECQSLQQAAPYVKAIARRQIGAERGTERIEARLKKLLADPLMTNLWMIETDDGTRYYTSAEPDLEQSVSHITSFDGDTRAKQFTAGERKSMKYRGHAPQVAVVEKLRPLVEALSDDNWEPSFCEMLRVVDADRAMDPIVKTNLLQHVLEAGTGGSYVLEKAFTPHLQWLKEAKLRPFTNWLDPIDPIGIQFRTSSAKKLESFPALPEAMAAAEKDRGELKKYRATQYQWVGWLHRARSGRWECLLRRVPSATGQLLVAHRPVDKPQLAPVGQLDANKAPAIKASAGSLLMDGRPVYLALP